MKFFVLTFSVTIVCVYSILILPSTLYKRDPGRKIKINNTNRWKHLSNLSENPPKFQNQYTTKFVKTAKIEETFDNKIDMISCQNFNNSTQRKANPHYDVKCRRNLKYMSPSNTTIYGSSAIQQLNATTNKSDDRNTMDLPKSLTYISRVGAFASISCILFYSVMFIYVKQLRNLPGYCLLSLSISLLADYISFVVQYENLDETRCIIQGLFLVYSFLASFFWINTIAYDVWKSIRMATVKLKRTKDSSSIASFVRYSFYAWGSPLIVIILDIVIHYTLEKARIMTEIAKHKLIKRDCVFDYRKVYLCYFSVPLVLIFAANIFFFCSSLCMISNGLMSMSQNSSRTGSNLRSRLYFSHKLGSIMGFTWIFGVLATTLKEEGEWLWYVCAVLNGLQGIYICFDLEFMKRMKSITSRAKFGRKSDCDSNSKSNKQTSIFYINIK